MLPIELPLPYLHRNYRFEEKTISLFVPDAEQLLAAYKQGTVHVKPYWGKVWPAALGLCRYLAQHPHLVAGKEVMELAAGLGLPSLLAAHWAHNVWCTDLSNAAVLFAHASARENQLENFTATAMDWNHLPEDVPADVLLLSDINYEPAVFETLFKVLTTFLDKGTLILLSTPQRLMAKPFIERLLPFCIAQQNEIIHLDGSETATSVFVLSRNVAP